MELTPGQHRLMALWGSIESAVSQRASTADLWSAAREASLAEGVPLTGVSATDMSGLRGMAAQMRNASEMLATAGAGASITGDMVAQTPWSRPLSEQNALGIWQVRYQHTVIEDGQPVTAWRTSIFEGGLPPTVEQLNQAVNEDALAVADSHGTSNVGISGLQILAV